MPTPPVPLSPPVPVGTSPFSPQSPGLSSPPSPSRQALVHMSQSLTCVTRVLEVVKNDLGRIGMGFHGTRVGEVLPGGPAHTAGVVAGMIIRRINDRTIACQEDAAAAFAAAPQVFTLTVEESLPSGWTAHTDQRSGRVFFYHSPHRRSQWSRPRSSTPQRGHRTPLPSSPHVASPTAGRLPPIPELPASRNQSPTRLSPTRRPCSDPPAEVQELRQRLSKSEREHLRLSADLAEQRRRRQELEQEVCELRAGRNPASSAVQGDSAAVRELSARAKEAERELSVVRGQLETERTLAAAAKERLEISASDRERSSAALRTMTGSQHQLERRVADAEERWRKEASARGEEAQRYAAERERQREEGERRDRTRQLEWEQERAREREKLRALTEDRVREARRHEETRLRLVAAGDLMVSSGTRHLRRVCWGKLQRWSRSRSGRLEGELAEMKYMLADAERRASEADEALRQTEATLAAAQDREREARADADELMLKARAGTESDDRMRRAVEEARRAAADEQLRTAEKQGVIARMEDEIHAARAENRRLEAALQGATAPQRPVNVVGSLAAAAEISEARRRARILDKEEYSRMEMFIMSTNHDMQGSIGMDFVANPDATHEANMTVCRLAPEGPAERSGLLCGDKLLWVCARPDRVRVGTAPRDAPCTRVLHTPKDLKDALCPSEGVYAGSRVLVGYSRPPSMREDVVTVTLDANASSVAPTMRKLLVRLKHHGEPRSTFEALDVERVVTISTQPQELCRTMYRVFRECDEDGNGELSMHEFYDAVAWFQNEFVRCPGLVPEDSLRAGFEELDRDGSGMLSFPEFFSCFKLILRKALKEAERQALEIYASPSSTPRAGPSPKAGSVRRGDSLRRPPGSPDLGPGSPLTQTVRQGSRQDRPDSAKYARANAERAASSRLSRSSARADSASRLEQARMQRDAGKYGSSSRPEETDFAMMAMSVAESAPAGASSMREDRLASPEPAAYESGPRAGWDRSGEPEGFGMMAMSVSQSQERHPSQGYGSGRSPSQRESAAVAAEAFASASELPPPDFSMRAETMVSEFGPHVLSDDGSQRRQRSMSPCGRPQEVSEITMGYSERQGRCEEVFADGPAPHAPAPSPLHTASSQRALADLDARIADLQAQMASAAAEDDFVAATDIKKQLDVLRAERKSKAAGHQGPPPILNVDGFAPDFFCDGAYYLEPEGRDGMPVWSNRLDEPNALRLLFYSRQLGRWLISNSIEDGGFVESTSPGHDSPMGLVWSDGQSLLEHIVIAPP